MVAWRKQEAAQQVSKHSQAVVLRVCRLFPDIQTTTQFELGLPTPLHASCLRLPIMTLQPHSSYPDWLGGSALLRKVVHVHGSSMYAV